MDERLLIQIPLAAQKMRLEDFLLDHFSALSKMYLRDVVKTGRCEVNGRHENIGHKLRENDLIEITVDTTRETAMRPENIPLDIVYEDGDIIVVNKPAGMLVHPSHRENTGTMLNALVYHCNLDSPTLIRPGLIHRLDKQTSGLVVVAKNAFAHRRMCAALMKKHVEKRYLALVEGIVKVKDGKIEAPIGRFAELKQWSVKEDGKHSESRFWVRERYADTTLIELEPVTGRTNQLRIHCELIGHPIVGDTQRGGREFERLCLHAWSLAFTHPISRERLELESKIDFD
ncbi:MAG: RluA family pseudouridine synthase [Chloracidobacterium sp.]|nr:RluA family pseudouridine synthase [Chloracidobacterium sp.]